VTSDRQNPLAQDPRGVWAERLAGKRDPALGVAWGGLARLSAAYWGVALGDNCAFYGRTLGHIRQGWFLRRGVFGSSLARRRGWQARHGGRVRYNEPQNRGERMADHIFREEKVNTPLGDVLSSRGLDANAETIVAKEGRHLPDVLVRRCQRTRGNSSVTSRLSSSAGLWG
jgi:hypothetical protein